MRLQGLFLRSAVARRVFWTLMAAATVPLLLFGTLGYHTLTERIDAEAQQVNQAMLKQIGLRVFDRLSAARIALASHAGSDRWTAPGLAGPEAHAMLGEIATLDAGGALVSGSPALAAAWREASAGAGAGVERALWWQLQGTAPARIIVGHRDGTGRGWWLGEINPGFLWADFGIDGAAAGMCVADLGGRALRCGNDAVAQPAPSWNLFLEAGFGAPDWRIGGTSVSGGEHLAALAFGRFAMQGALLTLLLVVTLSLVLVRRTMVPLEQLTRLTRRFAARDWSARASVAQGDEFGELATALNTMAERVGRQMHAMQVQAGIDRAILDGRDSGGVMQRVAERLQALLPQARVAVIARDAAGPAWQAYRAGTAGGARVAVDAEAAARPPSDGLAVHCGDAVPRWLLAALPELAGVATGHVCWVPARWHDELVALLVLAVPPGLLADEDVVREIAELRDRVAVTLAAAMREHHLVERAVRDGLTGLLNSHGMHEACERLLPAGAPPLPFSMVFVDLDAFKEVNDSLGHAAGDELLQAVARRLVELAPAGALLARPGGDEFVVLLPGPAAAAATLAEALCAGIAQPFRLRDQAVHVGASIGIASCPEHATDRNELMRRADLAMYAAKGEGRGRWRFYDAALDTRLAEKAWIVRELRLALETGQLQLHYQPRVDLRSRRVHSAEALLRWTHPSAGPIGPQRFIPIAEEAGLIEAIGEWVLDAALRQQRLWRDAGLDVGRVAVNVSPRQLRDDGFASRVLALLARHGLRPGDLEIEITEGLFVGDVDAVCARLAPLRDAGVLVALDDFGTGYSSLAALHRLPVDVLKIDRSFVVDLGGRASADAVARSIVALARALGKRVCAEGVETPMQEQHLVALGCDEIQGYLYARPMPPEAFAARLHAGFAAAPAQNSVSTSLASR